MKIKTVKKMNLPELIQYVWDNHLYPETFKSNFNDFAHFDKTGKYRLIEQNGINQATKFTVEVEEELTEETELRGVTTFIEKPNGIFPVYTASASIRECLDSLTDVENEPLKIFNGITEIWSKDTGIPEEGVLEVGVE